MQLKRLFLRSLFMMAIIIALFGYAAPQTYAQGFDFKSISGKSSDKKENSGAGSDVGTRKTAKPLFLNKQITNSIAVQKNYQNLNPIKTYKFQHRTVTTPSGGDDYFKTLNEIDKQNAQRDAEVEYMYRLREQQIMQQRQTVQLEKAAQAKVQAQARQGQQQRSQLR